MIKGDDKVKFNKLYLTLAMTLLLVLAACAGGNNDADAKTNEAKENDASNEEAGQGVEVEKGLMNVEITIPTELFGDELEDIEKDLEENWDGKIVKRDEDAITVKMSKKEHTAMLKEFKEDIETGYQELIDDEEFASIKDIQANKDFTSIKMIVDQEGFENSFDSFSILTVGISSMFYQVFDGNDIEKQKITIQVADEATGEVFHETVYPDALEEMNEGLEELEN